MNRTGFGALQEDKVDVVTTSVDIFVPEGVEKSHRGSRECIVRPTSMQSAGPFHFMIPSENNLFVDTTSIRLCGKVRLKKRTDTGLVDLGPTDYVTVCNSFPKSAFKLVETYLNGVPMGNPSTPAYGFRSVIENLLSYNKAALETHLTTEYFDPDLPDKTEFDKYGIDANNKYEGNLAAKQPAQMRALKFAKSQVVDFVDTVRSEITTMDRLIPSKVDIELKFIRQDDKFFIQKKEGDLKDYVLHFEDLYLTVTKIELDEDLVESIEKKLSGGARAIFPITRSTMRTKQIPSDLNYLNWNAVYAGKIPDSVVIAMVDSEAFAGKGTLNPYNFQHFNLADITLKINSVSIPSMKLETDFTKNKHKIARAYRHLMDNIGIKTRDSGCLITPAHFLSGYSLFCYDTTPDKCLSWHNHIPQTGVIDLDLNFKNALSKNVTVLALLCYPDAFELDHERKVYVNAALSA